MDVIDWPQEKIDALLKEYSDTEDIDVTLQNMGKRIEELERELAVVRNGCNQRPPVKGD